MKVKLKKTIPFVIGSATIKIGNKILAERLMKGWECGNGISLFHPPES